MCKTSVKKNLYWEVKDKVIEEAYNGVRSVKKSQKVRVYGTDSTKEVRARLIEILYDRVALHKDKFVAPILHEEMRCMEVKKNGKVEHSSKTHDDQVFSYLMALYVWYDGKDLAEKFHIIKNTIKTDQNDDIEELDIEDSIESVEKVDIESTIYDPDSDIYKELEWVESDAKVINTKQLRDQSYLNMQMQRDLILSTNKNAREAYAEETGLDPQSFVGYRSNGFVSLPDTLFMDSDDIYSDNDNKVNTVLSGNMISWWDQI